MTKILLALPIAVMLLLAGCDDSDQDDKTKEVDKAGAIETHLEVVHLPDSLHDVLITRHQIWKDKQLQKTLTSYDTLPALGQYTTVAEDPEGAQKTVTVPKEYEIYITVK